MFSSDKVKDVLRELDVLVVTADFTDRDPIIRKDFGRANRASLPVNLIYPADPSKPAILMPQILSPENVIEALRKAAE